jgi:hypothetical protein
MPWEAMLCAACCTHTVRASPQDPLHSAITTARLTIEHRLVTRHLLLRASLIRQRCSPFSELLFSPQQCSLTHHPRLRVPPPPMHKHRNANRQSASTNPAVLIPWHARTQQILSDEPRTVLRVILTLRMLQHAPMQPCTYTMSMHTASLAWGTPLHPHHTAATSWLLRQRSPAEPNNRCSCNATSIPTSTHAKLHANTPHRNAAAVAASDDDPPARRTMRYCCRLLRQ